MLFARYKALEESGKRSATSLNLPPIKNLAESFGAYVFNRNVMQKMLPKEVFQNVLEAMNLKTSIKPEYADVIALAMKEWALSHGATHYTHWFQPLTGMTAEKHDTFLDWSANGLLIEKFSGKELVQGEPDASSFPSGGLRTTYEARGYTGWDPTSPVFLWKAGDGFTLCIPSIFFSWTGEVLDSKIPFLRSDKKINDATLRLLKLTGIKADHVYSTLGLEQEYFVIDRAFRNLRPDLILLGKTVYGSVPSKGQELQDHYLGSVRDRVLMFMRDFEVEAIKLGIPVKTRHNEVAPSQYEVAPVFEKASTAIDHNILLMELMRHIAVTHDLSCLLIEKPFFGFNGSGKHSNWSLATDTGINLLDPSDTPGNNIHFLVLMAAILHAVHQHSQLLRASIGSFCNDDRLGGHEAPPAIISVYLGEELESIFENIEKRGSHSEARLKIHYDFGLKGLPNLSKENTDRNRTSPFAFTGNKFEFRAVGSSANAALPITVLNAIVAESLTNILDEIESSLSKHSSYSQDELIKHAMPVIRKYVIASKPIRFSGDNYSDEWKQEAKKRNLPIVSKSLIAFDAIKSDKTAKAFEGILTKQELLSRYEVLKESYFNTANIQVNLMIEMFHTQIFPAVLHYQKDIANSIDKCLQVVQNQNFLKKQIEFLKEYTTFIEKAIHDTENLKVSQDLLKTMQGEQKNTFLLDDVLIKTEMLRWTVDKLETMTSDELWPLPKYRELLFIL